MSHAAATVEQQFKFSTSDISDQKRLVRGEHWLMARTALRARDERHNAKWRIFTMSGGSPAGELKCIRELMPKSHIVACDRDSACLERAIEAGADDVVLCDDVLDYSQVRIDTFSTKYLLPKPIEAMAKFDVINLDLCGIVDSHLARALGIYLRTKLTGKGMLMLTFSYGRDVLEMFQGLGRTCQVSVGNNGGYRTLELPSELPETIAGRLMFLGQFRYLRSVLSYRGANNYPMCSALYQWSSAIQPVKFLRLEPGDFELAVVYPESANLYDCPVDRIQSLRRKFAAIKAGLTRKAGLLDGLVE